MSIPRLTQAIEQMQENLTGYIGTIDSDHAYIHKGIAFTAIINTGSISTAYDIAFKTPKEPDDKYIHWRPIGIDTSANYVDFVLREGDTYTGGTAVTPINRNRLSSQDTKMQAVAYNVTCTPAGTILYRGGVGTSGNPAARAGGGSVAAEEIVLKPDTVYVLTLTPAGATTVNVSIFWYEEPLGLNGHGA